MEASVIRGPGVKVFYVALTGNPNSGKTTVFNALTGLRAKVGNYPGVTVERKEGRLKGSPPDYKIQILDLPGTYSLSPRSLDEQVARDVLLNKLKDIPAPSVVVVIIDASNLQRNLYYATQVIELGYPVIIALNMMDVAQDNGQLVNIEKLSRTLGVPCIPLVASKGEGITALKQAIIEVIKSGKCDIVEKELFWEMPGEYQEEIEKLSNLLKEKAPGRTISSKAEALLLLTDEISFKSLAENYPQEIKDAILAGRERLESAGFDWRTDAIEGRYLKISEIYRSVVTELFDIQETFSDKIDRIVTHRIWGIVIFFGIMFLMFQSIFRLAKIPMEFLSSTIERFGDWLAINIPPGALTDLLVNGVVAGVGAVVVFLPQILLLFLFLSLLEDTGYMARAAFIMDRLMGKVGLHGKSFIPLLSSFACAIPGIMATRTIESVKDRLVTILIAPLMSCSARLPVYSVLIAATIPQTKLLGVVGLPGLVLMMMYLLGIILALIMALIFKKTLLKGEIPMLLMELPPYKRPALKTTLRHMWDRSKIFLRQAGTIILSINVILWYLTSYPGAEIKAKYEQKRIQTINNALGKTHSPDEANNTIKKLSEKYNDASALDTRDLEADLYLKLKQLSSEESAERLSNSYAGRLGKLIEPIIKPLGFDWKIGIGIISSFAARETFVSTMAVIYNVGENAELERSTITLSEAFKAQKREDGTQLFTPLCGITLMVFYVCALQCASTIVIVRRETNSWKWAIFQWFYLGTLAWILSFLVWNIGRALGYN